MIPLAESIIYTNIGTGMLVEFDPQTRTDSRMQIRKIGSMRFGDRIEVGKNDKTKQPIVGDILSIFRFKIK